MSGFGVRMPSENAARNNSGEHILKHGAGMVKRPSWSKSDPTVIRVFPCIQNNTFQPTRYSENDFSSWFYACTVVSGFGNPQKSWIAYDPEDRHYDTRSNPVTIIYDLANQVANGKIRGPQEWALALKGGQGRSALITKPDTALIVRCAIYEYKGQPNTPPDGLAPNHQTVFMLLKKSAWTSMNRELGTPSGVNSSENPNDKFLHGDIVSPTDGSFLIFFEMGMTPRGYESLRSPTPAMGYGAKMKAIGYDCIMSKTHRGVPASFNHDEINMISRRVAAPIRDSLNFPTDDEQIRFIVDSMRDSAANAGLVVHALRDRYERVMPPDFVSFGNEFLRQVGLMATSVVNPGFNPVAQPQQWSQPAYQAQPPAHAQPTQVPPSVSNYSQATAPLFGATPPAPVLPQPVNVASQSPLMANANMSELQDMINKSVSESSEVSESMKAPILEKLKQFRANNRVAE